MTGKGDANATAGADPRDDERDYEAEWEELDEKVILAQILAELQQIRLQLSSAPAADDDTPATYRCTKCDTEVRADERERHAQKQHKAPPSMATALFERVE